MYIVPDNYDLVAAEAKYHKACYSTYVSLSNAKSNVFKEEKENDAYPAAFNGLATETPLDLTQSWESLLTKCKTLLQRTGVVAES